MTTLREAAEMALEALDCIYSPLHVREIDKVGNAISALRSALEQLDHTAQPIEMVATCKECLPVEPMAFAYYWPPTYTLRRNPTYQLECGPTTAWKDEIPLYTAPPAAPVQEPVACQHKKPICDSQGKTLGYSDWKDGKGLAWWPHRSLYTAPPRREWQGLTDEEIWSDGSRMDLSEGGIRRFAREIEAKLKEKNT